MKRALLLWTVISLCFIVFSLQAEEQPLMKKVDHIFVTSDRAQEPANPLLGTGRGVDYVGIAVRDSKKTRDDYEQRLCFKFRSNAEAGGLCQTLCFEVPRG